MVLTDLVRRWCVVVGRPVVGPVRKMKVLLEAALVLLES